MLTILKAGEYSLTVSVFTVFACTLIACWIVFKFVVAVGLQKSTNDRNAELTRVIEEFRSQNERLYREQTESINDVRAMMCKLEAMVDCVLEEIGSDDNDDGDFWKLGNKDVDEDMN